MEVLSNDFCAWIADAVGNLNNVFVLAGLCDPKLDSDWWK